ncbi:putative Ndr family [Fasciola gigantica]|uniref:Putative Ndr family n=1 Tax=Fasciola gigantica TaxID=46835 RepID=A0A504YR97_FASGI|nr:putative Ndr family [Fasciola gigantica]
MYDSLVLGAILIHCTGQSASFAQAIKDKLVNWKLNLTGMNPATESFLILHRFGPSSASLRLLVLFTAFLPCYRLLLFNPNHLLAPLLDGFSISSSVAPKHRHRCPALLLAGSLSSQHRACRQFYEDLTKAQKNSDSSPALREFVMVDGVANVLAERPDKVIGSMQFFLQGLGLMSNLKIQKTPIQLNRRMSMQDYDRPLGKLHFVNRLSQQIAEEPDL